MLLKSKYIVITVIYFKFIEVKLLYLSLLKFAKKYVTNLIQQAVPRIGVLKND